MKTELFAFDIPAGLIAQTPAPRRDQSRLLVVDRARRALDHRHFADLPGLLQPGDTLFRNNAAVIPGRLVARRPTGARVECLLLERCGADGSPAPGDGVQLWRCLVKPARRLPAGARFGHAGGAFSATIASCEGDGVAVVGFSTPGNEPLSAVAGRCGEMPLPPYIVRRDGRRSEDDRRRYQTVYADPGRVVAAAAPTAGLHFTENLLGALAERGVRAADLTLHVGLGTFRGISADAVEDHRMHAERYEIPASTQRALFPPRTGRRVAVGTTAARAIEDFLGRHDAPGDRPHAASASIYIYPPRAFRGVDALITNFHQPRSTLLCLVAAFLTPGRTEGIGWLREIYREAVEQRYRFFSYGDAMLIL